MGKRKLARLKREMKQVGVTQDRVAKEAGVSASHVCNVLAGREISSPVVSTVERLIAERAMEKATA